MKLVNTLYSVVAATGLAASIMIAPAAASAAQPASQAQRREITRQVIAGPNQNLAITWAIASTKGPFVVYNDTSTGRAIGQPDPGIVRDVRGHWRSLGDFQGDDGPCRSVPDLVLADLRDYLDGRGHHLSLARGIASELTPARRCEPLGYHYPDVLRSARARSALTPEVPAETPATAAVTRRPRMMYIGDISGEFLTGARPRAPIGWRSWTTRSAVGVGTEEVNTCEPSCAASRFVDYPVRILLSDPQRIHGPLMFKHLKLIYLRAVPPGPKSFTYHVWVDMYFTSDDGDPAYRVWE